MPDELNKHISYENEFQKKLEESESHIRTLLADANNAPRSAIDALDTFVNNKNDIKYTNIPNEFISDLKNKVIQEVEVINLVHENNEISLKHLMFLPTIHQHLVITSIIKKLKEYIESEYSRTIYLSDEMKFVNDAVDDKKQFCKNPSKYEELYNSFGNISDKFISQINKIKNFEIFDKGNYDSDRNNIPKYQKPDIDILNNLNNLEEIKEYIKNKDNNDKSLITLVKDVIGELLIDNEISTKIPNLNSKDFDNNINSFQLEDHEKKYIPIYQIIHLVLIQIIDNDYKFKTIGGGDDGDDGAGGDSVKPSTLENALKFMNKIAQIDSNVNFGSLISEITSIQSDFKNDCKKIGDLLKQVLDMSKQEYIKNIKYMNPNNFGKSRRNKMSFSTKLNIIHNKISYGHYKRLCKYLK